MNILFFFDQRKILMSNGIRKTNFFSKKIVKSTWLQSRKLQVGKKKKIKEDVLFIRILLDFECRKLMAFWLMENVRCRVLEEIDCV